MARFRAWGLVLSVLLLALAARRLWLPALAVAAVLAFYLLAVRPARCRVETSGGRPCRRPALGLLGTCDRHADLKRGLPRLVSARAGALMFPLLMWPARGEDPADDGTRGDSPAVPTLALAATPVSPRRDRVMAWLVLVSVVIATASFIRDLAG
jgi:hypothetical protein